MDFVVEEHSPVKKTITVTAPAAEVNAALGDALSHFRKDFTMPGFRKGKVPSSVIERRFGEDMKARVVELFLGDKLEGFLREKDIMPLSRPEYDGGSVERGQEFTCKLTFDVMPAFELPQYVGMPAEQAEAAVPDKDIDEMIERLRDNMAQEQPVEESRNPVDGDSVNVDFAGFENGEAIDDVKGGNFHVVLGRGQVLPDFETIVRSLLPGEEKEGPVAFPDNYAHPGLAGKTITMRVKLNSLSTRTLPALDEEFAKSMGQESMEKLREAVAESLRGRLRQEIKSATQQKLMQTLLDQVDFPLPETMVTLREERIIGDARTRLERQPRPAGATPEEVEAAKAALEDSLTAMRPEAKREAETLTRIHLLLMAIARKENIQASQHEADMQLYNMAMRSGQDFNQIRNAYMRSGLMDELLERIQADKAMDFIYDKAVITTPGQAEAAEPVTTEPAGA